MLNFAFLTELHIMKKFFCIIISAVLLHTSYHMSAQTASSLFWRSDSLQVAEIVSETGDQYRKTGHHGPAVENSHMALRIYFNDSGAIDLYSKNGRGMELERYLWYPSAEDRESYGAGCDAYIVGKTVGFGGIALWDGEKEVKLVATKGRTARVGNTKKGSFTEVIAYGVEYCGGLVDICIRIDVVDKSRTAVLTANELSGQKVQFLTGVNYHSGQKVAYGEGYISVWGAHPAKDLSMPIGAGLKFSAKDFPSIEQTEDMVRIVSRPDDQIKTTLVGASAMEAELNNAKRFEAYMAK